MKPAVEQRDRVSNISEEVPTFEKTASRAVSTLLGISEAAYYRRLE